VGNPAAYFLARNLGHSKTEPDIGRYVEVLKELVILKNQTN
jgi:hypothetical protein